MSRAREAHRQAEPGNWLQADEFNAGCKRLQLETAWPVRLSYDRQFAPKLSSNDSSEVITESETQGHQRAARPTPLLAAAAVGVGVPPLRPPAVAATASVGGHGVGAAVGARPLVVDAPHCRVVAVAVDAVASLSSRLPPRRRRRCGRDWPPCRLPGSLLLLLSWCTNDGIRESVAILHPSSACGSK